jgi:hypothetical protein
MLAACAYQYQQNPREQPARSAAALAGGPASRGDFPLPTMLRNYLPALACALLPIPCYFLIRPYAEIGINEDWVHNKDASSFRFRTLDRHAVTESAAQLDEGPLEEIERAVSDQINGKETPLKSMILNN